MADSQRKERTGSWRSPDRTINERRTGGERRQSPQPVSEDQRKTERRSADRQRRVIARIGLGIDYLFFLLYGLLALKALLALVGANEQAGFVRFVQDATSPFYGPFSDIVASPAVNGGVLDLPALIALFAYGLLHLAIRKLQRVVAGPAQTRQSSGPGA